MRCGPGTPVLWMGPNARQRGDTLQPTNTGFSSLLLLRLLTVVNDNLLRWLVIGLGKRAAGAAGTALVLTIGTAGFVLPFVLLAWLAGWLADRYPKRSVLVWCKAAEIGIAAAAAAAIAWGAGAGGTLAGLPVGLWLLLGALVVIGSQATLLAPALLGTIPETVPQGWLAWANGVFALVTLAATLVGMAGGNWLADVTPLVPDAAAGTAVWPTRLPFGHALPATAALIGVAIAGWLAALRLPRRPAADPHAPPPWNALGRTWTDLRELCLTPKLAATAAGIVFFWAVGAVAQLNIDQFATESGSTSQGQVVPLLVALLAGIGVGSLVAGRFATHGIDAGSKVDLGFVPVGGIIMAVACFALAAAPEQIFGTGTAWSLAGPVCWLAVLGIGAGILDVPLEAYLQEQSPPARRGAILAATNFLVFAGMFAASLAYGGLRTPVGPEEAVRPLVSARGVFAVFGGLSLLAAAAAVYAAPRSTLRLFVASIVNAIWRFRTVGADRVPATGPVVLVANHLSWLDGFLLPMATPRPVRMVVYGPNIKGKFLRMLSDQWRFILFDPRPKSIGTALKAIQGGLADGDAIGIFCEGGISRTGQLLGFKRGLEWLLDKVESPIQTVAIDGLWGSGLTFSEGRYFTKRPRLWRRTITLAYGPVLPAGTHPDQARLALQEVAAGAVARRLDPHAATAEAFAGCCLVRREDRLLASLAAGDPLHESLGTHGARLLGIHGATLAADVSATEIASALAREKSSLWLARIDQVAAVAGVAAPPALPSLEVVVLPIGSASDLPRAGAASAAFEAVFGITPVVAYAPPEAAGLVAMNTPTKRIAWDHETINRPETVGRVVNGVVVWPHAADRTPLGLESLAPQGVGPGEPRTVVIGATLPRPAEGRADAAPRAVLLVEDFDVDKEGFLVPRG
jgi:acyl-[acyl-carrier-protein]-phospholipid O-acyltransferase/long-chain-fatty-acid--[acyl-carrier-protein] ligase